MGGPREPGHSVGMSRASACRAGTRLLRGGLHGLVALIWPGPCIVCGAALPGSLRNPVCPSCWAALPARVGPGCPRCDLPGEVGFPEGVCADCARLARDRALAVDTLKAALIYRDGAVTVHRQLKLAGADALVAPLARRMAICWSVRGPWAPDVLVPVPPTGIVPKYETGSGTLRYWLKETRVPVTSSAGMPPSLRRVTLRRTVA